MLTSWLGLLLGVCVLSFAMAETGNVGLLFNVHGFFVVGGGLLAAMLVSSTGKDLLNTLRCLGAVFNPRRFNMSLEALVSRLVHLAQAARQKGLIGLQEDLEPGDLPFLTSALDVAMVSGDLQQSTTQVPLSPRS